MCVEVFSITAPAALISEGLDMAHDPMSPEEAKGQTKVHFLSSSGVFLMKIHQFHWIVFNKVVLLWDHVTIEAHLK